MSAKACGDPCSNQPPGKRYSKIPVYREIFLPEGMEVNFPKNEADIKIKLNWNEPRLLTVIGAEATFPVLRCTIKNNSFTFDSNESGKSTHALFAVRWLLHGFLKMFTFLKKQV